jgi:hypothetical protein
VFSLAARDRAALLSRVGDFARRLEKALAEWQQEAGQGRIYPTTFQVRNAGGAYELGMTWKYDQGRFGEALIRISPEELQAASMRSGGGSDRLVQWWASLLYDAFRLYFMAMRPARTGDALAALYQSGVRVSPTTFDRSNSAVALARGYFALKASTGKDPFAELLVKPTASFQPPAIGS